MWLVSSLLLVEVIVPCTVGLSLCNGMGLLGLGAETSCIGMGLAPHSVLGMSTTVSDPLLSKLDVELDSVSFPFSISRIPIPLSLSLSVNSVILTGR